MMEGITRGKEAGSMGMGMGMGMGSATTTTGIRDGVGSGHGAGSAGRPSPAAVAAVGAGAGSTGEPPAANAPNFSPQLPTGITRLPPSATSWTKELLPLDHRRRPVTGLGIFSKEARQQGDHGVPARHGEVVTKMLTQVRWFTFIRIHQEGQDEFRLMGG